MIHFYAEKTVITVNEERSEASDFFIVISL